MTGILLHHGFYYGATPGWLYLALLALYLVWEACWQFTMWHYRHHADDGKPDGGSTDGDSA